MSSQVATVPLKQTYNWLQSFLIPDQMLSARLDSQVSEAEKNRIDAKSQKRNIVRVNSVSSGVSENGTQSGARRIIKLKKTGK